MSVTKTQCLQLCLLSLILLVLLPLSSRAAGSEMLDLDLESLMQIQITSAGRKAQNLSEVPAAVYVISQEALHNSGVTSIPEALRMVPGLQVARISSSKWAITSRGFNGTFSTKLLVQIDGRSVYAPSYSGVYWDVQNVLLEDVDRIEVIRGPGATVWGANAVNGVINIITKPASETQGILLSAGAGNQEKGIASFRYGTQLSADVYGRFYISHRDQDSYEFLADGSDARDDWNMTLGGFRFDGDVGLNDSWTLQGDIYRGEINQRVDTFWLPNTITPLQVQDSFDPQGLNLLGRWTHNVTETNSWSLQAYYDEFERGDIYAQQKYHILDVDFQHRFQLTQRHDIVWGLGYRLIKDSFGNTSQATFTPTSQSDRLLSAFIQDEINLIPERLWLTLGSKIENNDYTGVEIQPSARLLWKPLPGHSIWTSVSRAVRTPSRVEDSAQILTQNIEPFPSVVVPLFINGNSALDSEELLAYEAGYRFSAASNFLLDCALFYNEYSKLMNYKMTTGLQFENGIEGETYGVELSAEWKPRPWLTTELIYSYIELNMTSLQVDDINVRIIENSSPQHQIGLRSGVRLARNVQLNFWGRYVDTLKKASPQAEFMNLEVDGYFALDSNISWQLREGLELMLVGQNLLDSQHLEFVQENFTSPVEVGRSLYAKLTWKF